MLNPHEVGCLGRHARGAEREFPSDARLSSSLWELQILTLSSSLRVPAPPEPPSSGPLFHITATALLCSACYLSFVIVALTFDRKWGHRPPLSKHKPRRVRSVGGGYMWYPFIGILTLHLLLASQADAWAFATGCSSPSTGMFLFYVWDGWASSFPVL